MKLDFNSAYEMDKYYDTVKEIEIKLAEGKTLEQAKNNVLHIEDLTADVKTKVDNYFKDKSK